jgi:hypothetical protein
VNICAVAWRDGSSIVQDRVGGLSLASGLGGLSSSLALLHGGLGLSLGGDLGSLACLGGNLARLDLLQRSLTGLLADLGLLVALCLNLLSDVEMVRGVLCGSNPSNHVPPPGRHQRWHAGPLRHGGRGA